MAQERGQEPGRYQRELVPVVAVLVVQRAVLDVACVWAVFVDGAV